MTWCTMERRDSSARSEMLRGPRWERSASVMKRRRDNPANRNRWRVQITHITSNAQIELTDCVRCKHTYICDFCP